MTKIHGVLRKSLCNLFAVISNGFVDFCCVNYCNIAYTYQLNVIPFTSNCSDDIHYVNYFDCNYLFRAVLISKINFEILDWEQHCQAYSTLISLSMVINIVSGAVNRAVSIAVDDVYRAANYISQIAFPMINLAIVRFHTDCINDYLVAISYYFMPIHVIINESHSKKVLESKVVVNVDIQVMVTYLYVVKPYCNSLVYKEVPCTAALTNSNTYYVQVLHKIYSFSNYVLVAIGSVINTVEIIISWF